MRVHTIHEPELLGTAGTLLANRSFFVGATGLHCANGALYAFDPEFVEVLAEMQPAPSDFSTEVIPTLMGRIQSWHTEQPYLDIGTPQALTAAQALLGKA